MEFTFKCSWFRVIPTKLYFGSNIITSVHLSAHLALLFFFISGIHFSGAYFSNHHIWLKDAKDYNASAHLLIGPIGLRVILNSDIGNYFQGIHITSGIFQLWRSEGIITQIHLKYAAHASLIGTIICHSGSYFHMHMLSTSLFYKKFNSLSIHHLMLILGLSCISCAAHQIHISLPANPLLDSGVIIPLSEECAVNAGFIHCC
jgi:photosystem I P700 chlorophyll a apoprotein A1